MSDRAEGDISEADRDLVVKVRLAGLWEMPAGEMAQQKAENRKIRTIGRDIADQHHALDEMAVEAAKKLNIPLPDEPNADQQGWLNEMRNAQGADFDRVYIDRLRAAHGKIFPAIATVRASTRNDTVRKLAQRTNQFVLTHLTLLESSGIVDYASLPAAPPPAPAAPPAAAGAADAEVKPVASVSEPGLRLSTPMWVGVAAAGVAILLLLTTLVVRNLGAGRHRQRGRGADLL